MDIVEFLTAQYDEEEQLAKHAAHLAREGGTRWVVSTTRYVEDYAFVSICTPPPNVIEVAGSGFDGTGGVHGLVYAEHIARHDPARVLAETAAKRRILARHARCGSGIGWCADGGHELDWSPAHCFELADLAAPYADHPDFDPAWKVETS